MDEDYHAPLPCRDVKSMQQHRLAHQHIITAQKFVNFLHRRFIGNQLVDVTPEILREYARNEDFARMQSPVSEGDEIAFLPPVSGGVFGS